MPRGNRQNRSSVVAEMSSDEVKLALGRLHDEMYRTFDLEIPL
jgi:hypothetical protein